MSTKSNWQSIINLLAYCALVILAAVLLFAFIFKGNGEIGTFFKHIADALAYITVSFCALLYANYKWGKNKKVHLIVWAVSVVLVVIFFILPLFA